jgi:glutathione S-transferase
VLLYYTPRSHYSRKVRLLAGALGIELELRDVGNVGDAPSAGFGENPIMRVPALDADGQMVFDSDHIAHFLVRKHDPKDRFDALTRDVRTLNARAIMNGVMAAEVEIILARRSGLDTTRLARFGKHHQVITQGLDWLEARPELFPEQPSYAAFHLRALLDHLRVCQLLPRECPVLEQRLRGWVDAPYVTATAPPA